MTTSGLRPRTRRGYALGGVATGTYGTVPGLLLLPYLTDTVGIGAAVAGLIIFVPKAWDFFLNPLAGRVSDRSEHPGGRRRPFLIRAGLLLAVGFVLIFTGPTTPSVVAAAWVLAAFVAAATAYAFFQVPYLAMAAEITEDYSERTRLMTWRVIVITVSIMIAGATAPVVVEAFDGVTGYRVMAAYIGVLIVLGTLGVWVGTRQAPVTRHEHAGGRLGDQLRIVLGNQHARSLVTSFVLQAVATSMLLAGVAYAADHLTGDPTDATVLFVAFVAPAIVVAPLWERFGLRWGKKRGFVLTSLVLLAGLLGLLTARSGNLAAVLACAALVGVGYAGCQLFPLAMLPDVAAHDTARSGLNRIGMLSGVWAGFELLGFALGPAVLGLVLALGGYVSSTEGGAEQPGSALWAITLGISLIPAILVGLSLVTLRGYRLDDELRSAEGAAR